MGLFDEEIRASISQDDIRVPENVHARIEQTLELLPQRVEKRRLHGYTKMLATAAACLVFIFLVLLPNVSVAYAQAVADIPVIGKLVEVFTISNYFYSDRTHEMNAEIPEIRDPASGQAAELINKNIDELTSAAIGRFYKDMEINNNEGHGSVYIDYETVTNQENWFTLKLTVNEVAASSNPYLVFYHIDRINGKYVTFGDLISSRDFPAIEQMIREQMRAQMQADEDVIYWVDKTSLGKSITALSKDQNFYFNEAGDLVIVYQKYEVAPGSMGCPEFTIPFTQVQPYLRYPAVG